MTRPAQKERERNAVERLRQLYAGFPAAEPEESEEPLDFTVARDGSCVGIEVTDFVIGDRASGSQLDAFQSLTAQISEAATAAYRNMGAPAVIASIDFSRNLRCKKADIATFATAIASEVAKVAPTARGGTDIYQYDSSLPKGVDHVVVYQSPSPDKLHIGAMHMQWAADLLPLHIDDVIESKESKLPAYRAKCPEVWLVIVIEPSRVSGIVELSSDLTSTTYDTAFDRVLLLYNDARVIELKKGV